MDRNYRQFNSRRFQSVALRKESVDRNGLALRVKYASSLLVALRKESVDRNTTALAVLSMYSWSLSARRAWIEILLSGLLNMLISVALRKESVDRNMWWGVRKAVGSRRSPQGERG